MTEVNLNFAKIVANPTTSAWSQVYGAGKLFAAISLEKQPETEEKDYLNVLGKEILNTLEQEFFTLETKDLDSIRQAVTATSQKIPQGVTLSFVIGVVVSNVLYVYILGNGKADIKRGDKLGTLLTAENQTNDSLKEASGYLEENDVLILQTRQFADTITDATLSEFLENPSIDDVAENLAPLIHEKGNASISCIMVNYKKMVKNDLFGETKTEDQETIEPVVESTQIQKEDNATYMEHETQKENIFAKILFPIISLFKNFRLKSFSGLNHTSKVILSVVIFIIIIFIASIFFALNKQKNDKLVADFNSVYPVSLKKYEEGQSLVDLNQSLAKDSFNQAKTILETGKNKFPESSTQTKQINALLSKINASLGASATSKAADAKTVASSKSFYLSTEIENSSVNFFTKDDNFVYFVTSTEVSKVKTGSTTTDSIIKNNSDWKSIGGIATYNGNIYLVDKAQNQILKFLNTGSSFEKSDYFPSSVTPDFSKAVSSTIDNNIYVLTSNGTVLKYFKGQVQDFSLKGLDKPLLSPTKIYTTPDLDNIYVLDKGNSRIVVFDKTGSYKAEYLSNVIKSAKDFDVLETDKIIYVLSNGKVYEIDIK